MKRIYNVRIERLPEEALSFPESITPLSEKEEVSSTPQPVSLKTLAKPKPKPQPKPQPNLPTSVDLRKNESMPPVYDQGDLGSCTAFALCSAYSFDSDGFLGSRLFQYYNVRLLENNVSQDTGATMADSVKCLERYGLCPETEWPYIIKEFATKPPQQCYTNALANRATKVYNVKTTIQDMKTTLASGTPFVIGFKVFSSFESQQVTSKGIVSMPTKNDIFLGGHAVLVVGYNDITRQWIVRNSWGSSWGDKGDFYMPYQYLTSRNLASDAWCILTISLTPRVYKVKLQAIPEEQQKFLSLVVTKLPPTVDFRVLHASKMTPVYNQGPIGSCTANALCGAYSFMSPSKFLGSRLFHYYNERLDQGDKVNTDGSITIDNGSTLITGVQCLQKYGLCLETEWRYISQNYWAKPNPSCYANGLSYKLSTYANVQQTQTAMQTSLAAGIPFVIGFYVYASFESNNSLRTGYVPMPVINREQLLGGHAVLVVGYDMTKTYPANPLNPKAFPSGKGVWIIKNSWGKSVGANGYFYLPLPYLSNRSLTIELWCLSSLTK